MIRLSRLDVRKRLRDLRIARPRASTKRDPSGSMERNRWGFPVLPSQRRF